MTMTTLAVYENGVLRPAGPLPLAEGETVELTVTRPRVGQEPPTAEDADRRIREATTLREWITAADAAPDEDDDYDLLEALNENRRATGERLLFPLDQKGVTW
jgi:predicted DNA-binding antitoxin AbrB/MazE fold protein